MFSHHSNCDKTATILIIMDPLENKKYPLGRYSAPEKVSDPETYNEAKWAELQDTVNEPVKAALTLLEGLHYRWAHLMKSMTNREFDRTFFHPEMNRNVALREILAFYAWHCDHHFAQISALKKEKGWA